MIDRTAKIEIIQLKEVVIAKRNGIVVTVFYRECDFDIAKTIKKSIDYLTLQEDLKVAFEAIS